MAYINHRVRISPKLAKTTLSVIYEQNPTSQLFLSSLSSGPFPPFGYSNIKRECEVNTNCFSTTIQSYRPNFSVLRCNSILIGSARQLELSISSPLLSTSSVRHFKSEFSHKKPADNEGNIFLRSYPILIALGMITTIYFTVIKELTNRGWRKIKSKLQNFTSVDAASLPKTTAQETEDNYVSVIENNSLDENKNLDDGELTGSENDQGESKVEAQVPQKKKAKIGFKDRKIIEYENRIRAFSTPDKIFRYFATLRIVHQDAVHDHMVTTSEVYMTPNDFLRSITPGAKQPEGLGLDQFKKYDPRVERPVVPQSLTDESIFYKLGSSGLISFSDYIFLLTVLSASRRHFEIAFKMFDLNGDGEVDFDEFDKVQTIIRNQTSVGMRHRDHNNTGNTFKGVNSGLTTYFFGFNRERKLTVEKFLEFQERLQIEILTLEFCRNQPNNDGLITEAEFGKLLLTYAGLPEKRRHRMLKRVKKKYKENSKGITLKDYLQFFHFLNNINDVDTALTFYHIAGASIDQVTLKHVAKTVAQVNMTDHVLDVVFTLFDENQDGQLSNKEFISVMKNRLNRGLEKPRDTGFIKLLNSIWKCARLKRPVLLDI